MIAQDAETFAVWEKAERPYPWNADLFIYALRPPSGGFVATENKAAIGFAVAQVVDDEAYLMNLMVAAGSRRQGVARRLIEKVIVWARKNGARVMLLDVDPSNAAAVRLYEKTSFTVVERRPKSYPNGEDALLMKREI
jgi:ribosomal-protein-alanine N-acetyltransferase